MRRIFVLGAALAAAWAGVAAAGPIESACLKSGREGATRAMCGCIQDAADLVLDARDQRLAARFLDDPHRAQEVRQSGNRRHEAFWERYKLFGEAVEEFCAPRS
jgi:hypothetical protein